MSEPVRRDIGTAAEKIRHDPGQDDQDGNDPECCYRGHICEGQPGDDPVRAGTSASLRHFGPYLVNDIPHEIFRNCCPDTTAPHVNR